MVAWINNYILYNVWDEITYPFPNFNGATVEVWEWISNFTPHFTGHMAIYILRCTPGRYCTHDSSKVNATPSHLSHGHHFAGDIFKCIFLSMKLLVFWFEFHWSLFPRVEFTANQQWFISCLGTEHATSHSLTHICGTRGRWVDPPWPSDAYMHQ